MATNSIYYNGNTSIKKAGVPQQWTPEEILEYKKCASNPIYFIRKYTKIISLDDGLIAFDMWDYQEKMIQSFVDNRFTINLLPRQMGKSIVVAAYLLHYAIFTPKKFVAVLANKAPTAREILSRIKRMLEHLPFFLQPGVVEYNKGTVEFGNGSAIIATATSSDSIRGWSFNCVSGDTPITILDDYNRIYIDNIENAESPKYIYDDQVDLYEGAMFYSVYKITNVVNNKIYVGYHQTNNLDDGYMGSGKLIKLAIEKYGIDKFEKEYIEIFDNRDDAEALEATIVNNDFTLMNTTYNIALGGNIRSCVGTNNPFYGKTHSVDSKKLMSETRTGLNKSTTDDLVIDGVTYNSFYHARITTKCTIRELHNKLVELNNGYVSTEKQNTLVTYLNKIADRKKNNNIASSMRAKNTFNGKPKSDDHKRKISLALQGKKKSEDHVNKINKNPEKIRKTADRNRGSTRSYKTKQKMSALKKGKIPHNKGKVYCYDPITLKSKLCLLIDMPPNYIRGFVPKGMKNA